jgi:hypothetical protein
MKITSFPYAYWAKILGLLIIVAGITSFFLQHQKKRVFDLNELALGLSWGFIFIFFSREKTDDEMIHALKFRALTSALIMAFTLTHLYNYLFLNWRFEREHDMILSISAYQFVALTLMMATAIFYFLRRQASLSDPE